MSTTDDTTVKKRVIAILLANRLSPYAGTVSGSNSRYQVDQEITDAMLETDALVCQARLTTIGDPYRSNWMTVTGELADGDRIPPFIGALGDIDVYNGEWKPARYAASRADLIEMRRNPTLYSSVEDWAFVEDNRVFHNADKARAHIPNFDKTDTCQSPDVDETAVVWGTVGSLAKDGSNTPEVFTAGAAYLAAYLAMLKGETAVLPDVARFEARV